MIAHIRLYKLKSDKIPTEGKGEHEVKLLDEELILKVTAGRGRVNSLSRRGLRQISHTLEDGQIPKTIGVSQIALCEFKIKS